MGLEGTREPMNGIGGGTLCVFVGGSGSGSGSGSDSAPASGSGVCSDSETDDGLDATGGGGGGGVFFGPAAEGGGGGGALALRVEALVSLDADDLTDADRALLAAAALRASGEYFLGIGGSSPTNGPPCCFI